MKKHPFLSLVAILMLAAFACDVPFPPSLGQGGEEPATEEPGTATQPTRPAVTPEALPAGMPLAELDYEKVFTTLTNGQAATFEDLAVERYEADDFSAPGELSFTVSFPASQNVFWQYGWCAADEETLRENMAHIDVKFFFNDEQVDDNWAHILGSTQGNGWQCAIIGILLSDWKPGNYEFKTVATFDATVDDGGADFPAGDYVLNYDVSVK